MATTTVEQMDLTADIAAQVYEGRTTAEQGADLLASKTGRNTTSSRIIFGIYKALRDGAPDFKRTTGAPEMERLLDSILQTHGIGAGATGLDPIARTVGDLVLKSG